jgi:hypothetical protein
MSLIFSEFYPDRYPDSWREFDRYMPSIPTKAFGFVVELPEINRWAARYRAAASYEQAVIVQYQSKETVSAYSALIRSILVWSAFERFLPIVGLSQSTSGDLLNKYDAVRVAREIQSLDEDARLFRYIQSKVTNQTLARELDNYFRDSAFNASYLLSAIRHIFGHGHLTPGSNETNANVTASICNRLCDFHLQVMNFEFNEHVAEFKRMEANGWR